MMRTLLVALVAVAAFATAVEGRADDVPFMVVAAGDGFTNRLSRVDAGWTDGTVTVAIDADGRVSVRSPGRGLSSVTLSWTREWPRGAKFLNDAWERSYGELEWRALAGGEVFSPWYFLAAADGKTSGIGIETQPNAMACWKIGKGGYSLVLDVRAGGRSVRLGDRELRACRIVRAESTAGESAWRFGRRFCRMMCPRPRLPKSPVYGYNDWYCAYGKNTATNFLADAEYVVACAKGCENPPYVVMDDGWQKNSPPVVRESGRGPWDAAGPNFGMDMPAFCRAIAALGARPGLWYRPLRAWDELPKDQKLIASEKYLDPTVPSVRSRIVEDMRRFREWGFKLVKIDYLSFDISQLWPCDPHPYPELFIQDDRVWRDDTRTTAEVMLDLYRAMKDAAGDDVVIIGCNALNHLAAGVFELQRTGNDTSGRDWSWTRKNGVNTLAMRSMQDGAFFKIDADCVGLASEGAVPWTLNRQWMELLGRSGTPMFVSWRRELATPEVRKVLSEAFRLASTDREAAEPLDWFETRQPRHWRFADATTAEYDWQDSAENRSAWFREARFGMFIHWGLYAIPARGEWIYARHPWKKGEYEALAKVFNPTNYNPREWAKLAKRAGMKYAVLTTRHHDGFCMFDSHFTDYKITNTPYGKDVVREYVEAFRAEGLKVGFYHSLPDWTHPGYSDPESPDGIQGRPLHEPTPEEYAAFKELVANHVRQLMTEYGKIDLLFLDYTSKFKQKGDYFDRERLLKIAYECQPGIIVNDRLSFWKDNVRDFDYYTPEICVPSGPLRVKGREVPWETCATMNGSWGYRADDDKWKSPEALAAGLVGCVSRNGNLLLNVGPMADGSLPAPSVERLNALGDWYAANGESVFGCGKADFTPPFGCAYTQKGNALYCHFLQTPLGDVILPGLKGKITKMTLLRTGEEVPCIDQWGFELLKKDDQRIRPKGIVPGDVIKIILSPRA